MSMRTNGSRLCAAASSTERRFASAKSSSISSPIAVSFTETLVSMPRARIAASSSKYASRARSASGRATTSSPRKSSVALIPSAFSAATASIAWATVSPAMNRLARKKNRCWNAWLWITWRTATERRPSA